MRSVKIDNYFVFVDVETTGLDPKDSSLLEIAIRIADKELKWTDKGINVVFPFDSKSNSIPSKEVFEMHTKSGLLAEAQSAANSYFSYELELQRIKDYLGIFVNFPMTGNNVSFDRAFLKAHTPEIEKLFHYRNIDISTIKEINRIFEWAEEPKKKLAHRAMKDIEESRQELKFYLDNIFNKRAI